MEKVIHAQNALLARKLIGAALKQCRKCSVAKALEFAAYDALNESASMTVQAFIEGAEDCGINLDVARSAWHRGQKQWVSSLSFTY